MLHRAHLRRKAALRSVFRSVARIASVLLMAVYMVWFFYGFFDLGLVKVDQSMALRGRVTEREVNRQHFNWRLNGESTRYDLWSFEPGDAATRQLVTADSLEFMASIKGGFQYYNTLGFYLEKGARLQKEANSPYIMVEQNHRLTRWQYRP